MIGSRTSTTGPMVRKFSTAAAGLRKKSWLVKSACSVMRGSFAEDPKFNMQSRGWNSRCCEERSLFTPAKRLRHVVRDCRRRNNRTAGKDAVNYAHSPPYKLTA